MLAQIAAGLLAATSPPRALPGAQLVLYVPRFDKLAGISAFLARAGTHSPLLRPSTWRSQLHPLLEVDLTSADSLERSGIDPAGGGTISFAGDDRVSCTALRDPKVFEARATAKLRSLGEPWKSSANGVQLVGTASGGRVIAGYAVKGREACAVSSARAAEDLLRKAAALVIKPSSGEPWKSAVSLPGSAFLISPDSSMAIEGSSTRLTFEGRGRRLQLAAVHPVASSPYAAIAPAGLLFARAHADSGFQDAAAMRLQSEALQFCQGCDAGQLRTLIDGLVKSLSGDWMVRVESAKIGATQRSSLARYFAVKNAFVAMVSDPGAVERTLAALSSWKNAHRTQSGFVLTVPGGEIEIGLHGKHLYVANDPRALKGALEMLSTPPSSLKHGAEFALDPSRVAKMLSQLSLLDALGSRELAPLVAIGAELGPLLAASDAIRGWADSAGKGEHRFALTWVLKP